MTAIQEARDALDRASRIVIERTIPAKEDRGALADTVRSMFYATTRLVRLIHQNPNLSRVAGEAVADFERDNAAWAKGAHGVLPRLKGLELDAEKAFPNLRPPTPPDRNSEAWSDSFARFDEIMDRLLKAPQTGYLSKDETDTLRRILREQLNACDSTGADQAIGGLKSALHLCKQELRHAQRGQLLLRRSHSGAFWKWLMATIDGIPRNAPERRRPDGDGRAPLRRASPAAPPGCFPGSSDDAWRAEAIDWPSAPQEREVPVAGRRSGYEKAATRVIPPPRRLPEYPATGP